MFVPLVDAGRRVSIRAAMPCVSDADVLALLDGAVDDAKRSAIEQHLDECAECLEVVTLASKSSLAVGTGRTSPYAPTHPGEPPRGDGLSPGESLGRYEIVEPLGRGGMGMVYAARDVQLGRRVAIKVVAPDLAGSALSQLGLLREAQALARITQPNVLTVYDVGSVGDAVFLAAELVDGETLERWLKQPRRWRAIVELFIQAARGLAAVHAAGLVHRDFKPSNVLVGHDQRVRVFDFGVVRFADHAAAGRELAGTPIYMAPEQHRGEVADARADQYAFCASLHEALWGTLPAANGAPLRRAPSAVGRVPGWLRAAVEQGLASDPDGRFPSMAALIDALERGLGRRRRAVQRGLAALAVTAAAATAGLGYLHGRDDPLARCSDLAGIPWDAARKAELAAAFAATGVPYAAASAALVQHDLDRFAAGWRGQQRDACLAYEADRAANQDLRDRRAACLDHQRIMFEAVLDRFVHADRAVINQVPRLLGSVPDPEACTYPPAAAWPVAADARERYVAHAVELAAATSQAESGQLVEAASRADALVRDAAALGSRSATADAAYLAGHIAGLQGRYDKAVEQVESALWAAEAARYDSLVVTAACELIHIIAARQRRPDEARRFAELARAAAERVGSVSARARAARAIGTLETIAGRFEPAREALSQALTLAEARQPPDPLLVAYLEVDLANVEQQRGHAAAALPRLHRAIDTYTRELGKEHPTRAQALNNLGNALLGLERHGEAAKVFEEAIALQEAALGPDHPEVAKTRSNSVGVFIAAGELDRARQVLERNVAVFDELDPSHPLLASTLNNLAEVLRLQGETEAAERHHLRALAIRRQRLGDHHPEVTRSLLSLAALALRRGDVRTAGQRCEEAKKSISGSDANNKAVAGIVETCRGEVELRAGHSSRAVAIFEHALQLHGTEDPGRLADTQFALARALPASARPRALELARAARESFQRQKAYRAQDIAEIDRWLAGATANTEKRR
jgi:tetratricopeptide (TPR) repeat protein